MRVGDKVSIDNTNEVWDNKVGVIEELDDTEEYALVRVEFGDNKFVRQEFNVNNLTPIAEIKEELNTMEEKELFKQVADVLDIAEEDLKYSNGTYIDTTTGDEYEVKTYEELEVEAIKEEKSLLELEGVQTLFGSPRTNWFAEWIYHNAVDEAFVEDCYKECLEYQYEDMRLEELADEAISLRLIDEEDAYDENYEILDSFDKDAVIESIIEYQLEKMSFDEIIEYLFDCYGDDFADTLEKNNAFDYEKIAEEVVSQDGIDNYLAILDYFAELDYDNFLIKIN